jgi:hypothetical protein
MLRQLPIDEDLERWLPGAHPGDDLGPDANTNDAGQAGDALRSEVAKAQQIA